MHEKPKYKREIVLVLILIAFYIFVRSLHFSTSFNFSSEQAMFASKSLEIFREKKIELIGPPISWRYDGRVLFQGSAIYYAMIPFLLMGNWNPLVATYLVVIFGALMIIPLYVGVKYLVNKRVAAAVSFFYAFLPFYIDYTRQFWNPTFQFLLTPIVILFMGLYSKYKRGIFLFLISFTSGVLTLFHYQYILVSLVLVIYYLARGILPLKKLSTNHSGLFYLLIGFPLGFMPMAIFEFRNNFYNTHTLRLFIAHADQVFPKDSSTFLYILTSYYMLSISLFLLIAIIAFIEKLPYNKILLFAATMVCSFYVLITYSSKPEHAFGMTDNWDYLQELKVFNIIRSQNLSSFNVVNLKYDTVASVQKYFLIRDNIEGNWGDYKNNKYLFVLTNQMGNMDSNAYEIATFSPNEVINKWSINNYYGLYLLKRL